jgi:hypothetical protein
VTHRNGKGSRAVGTWGKPWLVAPKASVSCPPRSHKARLEAACLYIQPEEC